jgi:hypothetical protein
MIIGGAVATKGTKTADALVEAGVKDTSLHAGVKTALDAACRLINDRLAKE